MMNYLKLAYNIVAAICIIYAIFRPMDVLSWFYGKSKNVVVGIYNLIKSWIK